MFQLLPAGRIKGLMGASRGLSTVEVTERRAQYGANTIIEAQSFGWKDIASQTGRDPMIWFLLGTSLLFMWIGDYTEAVVLAVALVPIVGMDTYLHRRTQASTEGLAGRLATTASVIRNGAVLTLASESLVPGDLVIVPEGGSFPADGLIVEGRELQVDESTLTGEAMPVRKTAFTDSVQECSDVRIEGAHWGLAGTRLLMNDAKLRIVFTGSETLYGQIVRTARSGTHENTPLQQATSSLVTVLILVSAVICIALAATRYYQGHGLIDALVSALTLAVAALPEEFPVVLTFFVGVGVYRLAKRQALVRRGVVVENIGRVTCICSDKTGTLTEGNLRLAHCVPINGATEEDLLRVAARASRVASADPLDQAILARAGRELVEQPVLATFPFTESRRRETSIRRNTSGALSCATKGAPETILGFTGLNAEENHLWQTKAEQLAATGHKVIACAECMIDGKSWAGEEPDREYNFLGLLAFEDPVRPGVAEAVAEARRADIRVIMVTGDHSATARTIAKEVGIGDGNPRVIEGEELSRIIEKNDLGTVDVIARAVPAVKLELVLALQRTGEIVAVTGDGVNDAPALQRANIGIAMGEGGARTAREVASIVLLDDNFRTIVRAIAEGRQLFKNLRLSFAYLLMVHIPLVTTAALIPFFGFPLLYLPAHIVWLELIIHPTALLVFQQLPTTSSLERVRRTAKLRFFNWKEWSLIVLTGTLTTALVLVSYAHGLNETQDVEHARTMSLVALVVASSTITVGLSSLRTKTAVFVVIMATGSAIAFAQIPLIAGVFHLTPLHDDDWLFALFGGVVAGALAILFPRCGAPRIRHAKQLSVPQSVRAPT